MNIAIDTTPLNAAHGGRGVGSYTRNLIEALQKYESQHSYKLFTRIQKVPKDVDLVHYSYFDPFFLTLPMNKPKPTVVTVHDLIPLIFPDRFPPGIRGSFKWRLQKLSLVGAKRIITDSKNSAHDIVRILGFPDDRIDVVYLAPAPGFTAIPESSSKRPFVLYVGDVNWNKNIPGLLEGFSKVADVDLVLVGGAFMDMKLKETKEINRLITVLGIGGRTRNVGYVSQNELRALYSTAACLVQPSFYEGFGLPVLEAMACGCPVVSTRNSSLSEIAGPAIEITTDAQSIADGIHIALGLNRSTQVNEQFKWLEQFSWQKTAALTVAAYEKAVNNHTSL
jgi:glycosyltransferase involved in cell wall biosynthesis